MEEQTTISIWGSLDIALIIVAAIIVLIVLYFQIKSFNETRKKIQELISFFPNINSISIFKSSIKKSDIESSQALKLFIDSPRKRQEVAEVLGDEYGDDMDEDDASFEVEREEYTDVDIIKAQGGSTPFKEVIAETNSYLCKNVGTSADFAILEDICNSKIDSIETEIQNSLNVPLYLGLGGTFIGIIVGLAGIVFNLDTLFGACSATAATSPLRNLLLGVVIAMVASFVGLGLMTWNSAIEYKKSLRICDRGKISYFDFLRRELMPSLSNSMASSLNSLKSVLGEFIGKFGRNLSAYNNSAEILNDNIEKQHLLLVEINKMNQTQMATAIAETFNQLNRSSEAFSVFHKYQEDLNNTVKQVESALSRIDDIILSFDNFSKSLSIVVENQGSAAELQAQFQAAIEKHFPIGSDAREVWRKEFDELTTDAKTVTDELNSQLKASTEYIRLFTENNKDSFTALGNLGNVLESLVKYANVQATCYKDLKEEIQAMKDHQSKTQADQSKLNADLLTAVREMISAIKTMKN
ncbi:MAG: hypothetical protein HDR86_04955 [Bacteroides sp.]|nr:hypothetical protein [Bacteroides sp.]